MAFNTIFQLNSGDIINFGYSHSEGLIADIDILSDYEQKRHFNIKEKEMTIPKKQSLKLPEISKPKPRSKNGKAVIYSKKNQVTMKEYLPSGRVLEDQIQQNVRIFLQKNQ